MWDLIMGPTPFCIAPGNGLQGAVLQYAANIFRNYVTSDEPFFHKVLYSQQLSIARYRYANNSFEQWPIVSSEEYDF